MPLEDIFLEVTIRNGLEEEMDYIRQASVTDNYSHLVEVREISSPFGRCYEFASNVKVEVINY